MVTKSPLSAIIYIYIQPVVSPSLFLSRSIAINQMVNRIKYLIGGIVYIIFTIPLFLVAIIADAFNSYSLSSWVRRSVNWLSDRLLTEADNFITLNGMDNDDNNDNEVNDNEDSNEGDDRRQQSDQKRPTPTNEYKQLEVPWYKEALGYILMIPLTIITMLLFLLGGFLKFQPFISCGFTLGRFLMDLFGIEDEFVYENYDFKNIEAKTK